MAHPFGQLNVCKQEIGKKQGLVSLTHTIIQASVSRSKNKDETNAMQPLRQHINGFPNTLRYPKEKHNMNNKCLKAQNILCI